MNNLEFLLKDCIIVRKHVEIDGVEYDRAVRIEDTDGAFFVNRQGKCIYMRKGFNGVHNKNRPLYPHKTYPSYRSRFNTIETRKMYSYTIICYAYNRKKLKEFSSLKDLTVNHIDGDIDNNSPDNLEFCTISENSIHGKLIRKLGSDVRLSAVGLVPNCQ